jgi:hypothetical protein
MSPVSSLCHSPLTITLRPPLKKWKSPRSCLSRSSPSSVIGEGCLKDLLSVMPLHPLLWRRISPGSSLCHASPSSATKEDVSRMEEDVSRILFLPSHSVLRYGGRCLTVTPLHPPLWRRMSSGSPLCHFSPSSVMEDDVSRILSLSRLSILHYGG